MEDKRGVEFCHSTHDAARIRQKLGNGSVLMGNGVVFKQGSQILFAYTAMSGIQCEVKFLAILTITLQLNCFCVMIVNY